MKIKLIPNLTIVRLQEAGQDGTFGVLLVNSQLFSFTLERNDLLNLPNISSIPAQQYLLKRKDSPRFGDVFEVTGVPGRSGILFHIGNWVEDTEGCILLGSQLTEIHGRKAIMYSKNTIDLFMETMEGHDEAILTIKEVYS